MPIWLLTEQKSSLIFKIPSLTDTLFFFVLLSLHLLALLDFFIVLVLAGTQKKFSRKYYFVTAFACFAQSYPFKAY